MPYLCVPYTGFGASRLFGRRPADCDHLGVVHCTPSKLKRARLRALLDKDGQV